MGSTKSNLVHGKKGQSGEKGNAPAWIGFVDIPLSAAQKETFKSWHFEADDILGAVAALVTEGYKLSVSYDQRNGCFQASLTCNNPDDPNCGFTMSARAGDSTKALAVVLYKHLEVAQGGVWANVASPAAKDDIS